MSDGAKVNIIQEIRKSYPPFIRHIRHLSAIMQITTHNMRY
jgi:hypothetical protein